MAREKGREDGAEHSKESEPAAVFPPFLLFICFRIFSYCINIKIVKTLAYNFSFI